ncbi:hypothetical protein L484_026996 [Morus notabilis]|uniref:Uncharacterized protein n=1 Tax=Morus notabilis TaxID=981085 RepID=W9RBR7_9ROSA|nr:hypothetical protein L484_026996 [Morus notabilis]
MENEEVQRLTNYLFAGGVMALATAAWRSDDSTEERWLGEGRYQEEREILERRISRERNFGIL